MLEPSHGGDLGLEASTASREKHLQGDDPPRRELACPVDDPHAAASDDSQDLIPGDCGKPSRDGHGLLSRGILIGRWRLKIVGRECAVVAGGDG